MSKANSASSSSSAELFAFACGNPKCRAIKDKLLICSRCRVVHYCDRDCQQADFAVHKSSCERVACLREEDHQKTVTSEQRIQLQQWLSQVSDYLTTFWAAWMYKHHDDQERVVIEAHYFDGLDEDVTCMKYVTVEQYIAEDEKVRGHERQIIESCDRNSSINIHYLHWRINGTAAPPPRGFFSQLQSSAATLLEDCKAHADAIQPLVAMSWFIIGRGGAQVAAEKQAQLIARIERKDKRAAKRAGKKGNTASKADAEPVIPPAVASAPPPVTP